MSVERQTSPRLGRPDWLGRPDSLRRPDSLHRPDSLRRLEWLRRLDGLVRLAAVGSFAWLAACALEPVHRTYEGRLEEGDRRHDADGSFYDEYRFDAEKGWRIRVEMTSTELDPFLQLRRVGASDADFLRQNDDAEDGSTTARISLRAPSRGTYVVWANSFQSGQTGAYSVRVDAKPEAR